MVRTLKAALLSFAVAVLAWNLYAAVKGALRAAHGRETSDEKLSDHHLAQDVILTQTGLEIAVDATAWERHRRMSPREFGRELLRLARHVKLSRSPKTKRGPEQPQPRKKSGERNHPISTARLLDEARSK